MSVVNAIRNPRTYLRGAVSTYRTVLFDPETFFDELNSRGFRKEFFLALAVALIGYAGPYMAASRLLSAFQIGASLNIDKPDLRAEVMLQVHGQAFQLFLFTIVFWVVAAALMYLGSWLYSERSDFRHMLKNTTWGLVPLVFANAIQSIGYYMAASGVTVDSNNPDVWFRSEVVGSAAQQTRTIWGQVADEPLVLGATAVGIVFLVWCWHIWAHALVDVRGVDQRTAYLLALLPVAAFVLGRAAIFFGII